jgi:septal ring factor EnvC (AmiA/AmiB activator)
MGAYAPATPQEELLTFRITQKSWILRRLDTFERVIADSAVTKVREQHPNAAPAACIAMTFLTRNDTEETSFYNRIAQQRKDHEATLDRLESKLQTLQHRREARADRHQARDDRRQAAAPKRQTSIDATPSPFHQAPTPTLRATG